MMKRAALALLLLATLSGRSEAAMIMGAGASASCGNWLEARRARSMNWIHMSNWALGYISGAAVFGEVGDPLARVDADGVDYWLDNWCRARPSSFFKDGVKAFIAAHGG